MQPPSESSIPSDARAGLALDVAALTRRMVAGDDRAYRMFYDAYFNRLNRYLMVVTGGNEVAAREALQAALVRVVRHIKVFPHEAAFWGWLTVVARTALADETRRERRYLAFLDRFTRHHEVHPVMGENGEADERLRALLQQGLAALPVEERELIEQKYFDRRSVRNVAEGLQTTEKAVESRLARIRRKLKDAVCARLKDETSS